jgi:hypothetical protein
MFPPEDTDDPQVWANGLWETFSRTSDHFNGEACVTKTQEGVDVALFLQRAPSPDEKKHIIAFAREYLRSSGWRSERLKFDKRYLLIQASRLASKASAKR